MSDVVNDLQFVARASERYEAARWRKGQFRRCYSNSEWVTLTHWLRASTENFPYPNVCLP